MNRFYLAFAFLTVLIYAHSIVWGFRSSPHRSPLQFVLLAAIFIIWVGAIYIGFCSSLPSISFQITGGFVSILSLALFFYAHSQHRAHKPCKAFSFEEPSDFVTSGPYRHIRHPIYVAYLLSVAAFGIYSLNPFFAASFVVLFVLYTIAAAREEQTFLSSVHRDAYKNYMRSSGRFLPKFHATNVA